MTVKFWLNHFLHEKHVSSRPHYDFEFQPWASIPLKLSLMALALNYDGVSVAQDNDRATQFLASLEILER